LTTTQAHDIDIEDVEYLRHGDRPLLARLFKPRGCGPFPLIIDLHGGAWCVGDRLRDTPINEPLARTGVVVAALDFRAPPDASYPGSFVDINYAIRWLKARATTLNSRADLVGIFGSSSGAHQAALLGMRPNDPRYGAIPLPAGSPAVDASLRCLILGWPVIDPLARYHYAKKLKASGQPRADIIDVLIPMHDKYWVTEEAMAEGNPVLALERGERVATPPILYIQGTADPAHPRVDLDRFVTAYRKAGGNVQLEFFEGEDEAFPIRNPSSPASAQAVMKIIEFVHAQLG
jgi:acetyl esterase/lipase